MAEETSQVFTPYKSGFLPVSDGYELYYECYGNPKGKPVLFVHGGPGAGTSPHDARFFNLDVWNVILLDQRGSGKSKPFASLENNTTQKLVEDFIALLDFLQIEKTFLFGGSWGSTLSLAFAVEHPEKVLGMVIRGIFLGTKAEIDYWVQGGIAEYYPEVWERFISFVPENRRKDVAKFYLEQMQSSQEKTRNKFTYEWAYYEMSLLHLEENKQKIEEDLQKFSFASLSPIEIHYMLNNCFFPENYLLDNAHKLANIPVSIVNGRYDVICPPESAYKLYKAIPHATVSFVTAGHSSSDPKLEEKLIEEMKKFE